MTSAERSSESGSSTGPSAPLLERLDTILTSSSTPPQKAVILTELRNRLEEDALKLDRGTEEVESTLFFDPFPIFLALGPLLRSQDDRLRLETRACLNQLARYSSAKEMVMAIGERFAQIGPPDDGDDDSEDSEDLGDVSADEGEPWDGDGAARELVDLIRLYGKVLPRVKALRPANFLATAVDLILSAVRSLLDVGTFESNDGPSIGRNVFSAIVAFIELITEDAWIAPVRDQCVLHLQTLMNCTSAFLHRFLSVGIAERFFIKSYPRYRIPDRVVPPSPDIELIWANTLVSCDKLSMDAQTLLASATNRSESKCKSTTPGSLTSSIGSFILLAHLIDSKPNLRPSMLGGTTSSELLSSTLPLLMISFGGSGTGEGKAQVGEDEALFWVWWCVEGAVREGEEVDDGILFPLIDLLCSLASLSPSSSVRFLAFRLVSTLVLKGTTNEVTQLMILEDLLKDCPFEEMKLAGLGLLREVLADKFADKSDAASQFVSPDLLLRLESVILRFEPVDLLSATPFDLDVGDFCEQFHRSTLEKLGLYYLLLVRDLFNETGIKSTKSITSTNELFIDPLRRALVHWSTNSTTPSNVDGPRDGADQQQWSLQLAILEDSLARVTDAVKLVVTS